VQNQVISEKESQWSVVLQRHLIFVLEDFVVKIFTRKHEKDLQLIWGSMILSSDSDPL